MSNRLPTEEMIKASKIATALACGMTQADAAEATGVSPTTVRKYKNKPEVKEMIESMADRGGVMGINFAPGFVHHTHATVQGVVDHIDYIVGLVGSDHVGLGSDFDGISQTPLGFEDVTKMPNITAELVKRGYTDGDIKKILGENHLRLIKQVIV